MMDNDIPPFSLMYNHIIRIGLPPPIKDEHLIPVVDDQKISLGDLCLESTGFTTTMTYQIPEKAPEFKWGFRYIGDNHIHYRDNGSTTFDGSPGLNDITNIIRV